MRRVWIVAAIAVLAVAVAGLWWASTPTPTPTPACQPVTSGDTIACSTIDGFPIGQFESECSPQSNTCLDNQTLAALDARDLGHPPIQRERLYSVDLGRVCTPGQMCWSNYSIVVFDLADGTHRAVGIRCVGIAPCQAVPRYDGSWG
jgi:hypothetical protein